MPHRTKPPVVVNVDQVEPVVRHPQGGGTDRPLLTHETAGTELVLFGHCVYAPGRGSQWHSHEEEDCFFVVSGTGTLFYERDGIESEIPLRPGDAVFSGYLRNFVRNTGVEDLVLVYAIAPKDRYEE